ncbi:MAG: dihydrofolate reductase family protein [Armatimonadota bacterium]
MILTITTFLSLDGVMQAPGGPDEDRSHGFSHGGWLVPYADPDMGRMVDDWFAAADSFLLGRKTYEIFAAHWPHVTAENDPVAAKLNSLPKYVVSKTLDKVEWNNSTLIKGDVAEEVAKLKRRPGKELQVHGSGELAQTLMQHDLVDEYRLWFYPVVLGSGKRLFREGGVAKALRLVSSNTTSTGVTVNSYQPAGEVKHGSFEVDQYETATRALFERKGL